jgi:hypothetical protein
VCWANLTESQTRIRGDNIKEGHKERGYEGMEWIHLALGSGQRRVREKSCETHWSLKVRKFE